MHSAVDAFSPAGGSARPSTSASLHRLPHLRPKREQHYAPAREIKSRWLWYCRYLYHADAVRCV